MLKGICPMLNQFYKYQSLGNDFIIFDWYKKPMQYLDSSLKSEQWSLFVKWLCDRNHGIGADGILLIKNNQQAGMPEMLIFNRDGSESSSCINGIRCSALHMTIVHRYPEKFSLKMGSRIVDCFVAKNNGNIATTINDISFEGQKKIKISERVFTGHLVDVGNPHYVIFDEVEDKWLELHGSKIEQNEVFPNKTNVEFVTKYNNHSDIFFAKIYERGCGVTKACSSGAVAISALLINLGNVIYDQSFTIKMPGGSVQASVLPSGSVVLEAPADAIFEGILVPSAIERIFDFQK